MYKAVQCLPSAWGACVCKQKLIYCKVESRKSHCSAPREIKCTWLNLTFPHQMSSRRSALARALFLAPAASQQQRLPKLRGPAPESSAKSRRVMTRMWTAPPLAVDSPRRCLLSVLLKQRCLEATMTPAWISVESSKQPQFSFSSVESNKCEMASLTCSSTTGFICLFVFFSRMNLWPIKLSILKACSTTLPDSERKPFQTEQVSEGFN